MINSKNLIVAREVLGWTRTEVYKLPALVPDFMSDATWDYAVLEQVRDTWQGTKLQTFLGCLFAIYTKRTKQPELLFLQYQVGDYSTAALSVLGA